MRRGTTPTHIFTTDIDLTQAEVVYLTYKQGGEIVLEREVGSMEIAADKLTVELTQEETLGFTTVGQVHIQIRARYPDGSAIASNIISTTADEILKDGVI